jgi:hypothetical protein
VPHRSVAARIEEDTLQLGGGVRVGADGRIGWIYESSGPEDRPAIATIRAVLHVDSTDANP